MAEVYYTDLSHFYSLDPSDPQEGRYWITPADFYGDTSQPWTAYDLDPHSDQKNSTYNYTPAAGVVTNDIFVGSQHSDQIYGGAGNDILVGKDHNDTLVGGCGNDHLQGDDNFDILLGDWAEMPNVAYQNNLPINWSLPPEDTSLTGNDNLDGGDGPDIIIGGPGNDQINGGPRAQGNLDDVTGGPGADLFLLNYTTADTPQSSAAEAFWNNFGQSDVQDASTSFFDNSIEKLGEAAWKAALGSVSDYSGLLLGPLGQAGGELITDALSLLLQSPKPAEPKSDDVLVIRDFDPREDVLVLPLETGKAMKLIPTWVVGSSAEGNVTQYPELHLQPATGWYLSFQGIDPGTGDLKEYAQIFLSQDYMAAIGLSNAQNDPITEDALLNLVATAAQLQPGGQQGLQNADQAYAFSGIDQADQPTWQTADSGTQAMIFGAFGPTMQIGANFAGTPGDGMVLGGTNFADQITGNKAFFDPSDIDNFDNWGDASATIFGFGGNDYLYGGKYQDKLHGGDGDDKLYGFDNQAPTGQGNQFDVLWGDDGNDILFSGAGTTAMDGGSGSDTASYQYADRGMTIDLSTPPDFNDPTLVHNFPGLGGDFPGVDITTYFTGHAVSTDEFVGPSGIQHYDALANIQNIVGSEFDDIITGSADDNIIDPYLGNDTIDGKGGTNTISYRTALAAVTIDLSTQTTTKSDGQGTDYTDHYTGFVNAYGSDFDDTITGTSGDNLIDPGLAETSGDTIIGNGGIDTIAYFSAVSGVTVDLHETHAIKYSRDGTMQFTDSLTGITNIIGSPYDDPRLRGDDANNTIFYSAGNDNIDGFNGYDTLNYKDAPGPVTINVNAGTTQKTIDNGGDPPTSAGTDTFQNMEAYVGSAYDDTIIGGNFSTQKTSSVTLSTIAELSFDGGKGHDIFVLKGSIGDVDIAHDFSEVGGDTFKAAVEHIEVLKFDDFTVKLKEFDAALTNRAGKASVHGSDLAELIVGHKSQADHLHGAKGNDALLGLGGRDQLQGGKGKDILLGNGGADTLQGGAGRDSLKGGSGADQLRGGADRDTLAGGKGKDAEFGGAGNDIIRGGAAADSLHGGSGRDNLDGGKGDDVLAGGKGSDTFVFSTALGPNNVDTIRDFRSGDVIALDASVFKGIGPHGMLAGAEFGTSILDFDARIIYDKHSGGIFYNETLHKLGGLVLFATVSPNTHLGHGDFLAI